MKTKPETERAILWCADCKRPTKHLFDHVVRVVDAMKRKGYVPRDWYELMFRCEVCGAKRRWGTEMVDRSPKADPDEAWLCAETRQSTPADHMSVTDGE